jgi:hypothetical protein
MAEAGDVLIKLHMHEAVFGQRMHLARLRAARFELGQRLRQRDLIDEDLVGPQRRLRNAMPRLDDGRFHGAGGGGDPRRAGEEAADGNGVGSIVGALVDDLEHILRPQDRRRHLDAARAPAVGERHLPPAEGHLMARDRDRLEDRAADHALRLFVEIGEVVAAHATSPAVWRMRRIVSSSL